MLILPFCFDFSVEPGVEGVESFSPLALRLIGLREGAFGNEGREGLICGGPGDTSSITWENAFNSLKE